MSQTHTQDQHQVSDFKGGVQKLSDRAGEVKENFSGMARDAASSAKAGAEEVSKDVKQTFSAGKKSAAEALEGFTDRISKHPLTTISVALGVGVVIGFLLRRPRA